MNFHITLKSDNAKTGPITVTTSHKGTCPDACPLKGAGCYAQVGKLRYHWGKVSRGERGGSWAEYLIGIKELKAGAIVRLNQAGDLVGANNMLDATALRQLTKAATANAKRVYGYTHYPLNPENVAAIQEANANGLTINASTNKLDEVDMAMDKGVPVVTILPVGTTVKMQKTKKGRIVLTCPASLDESKNCKDCMLCALANRPYAIGFVAHGICKGKLGK
jgi:intracellular sulfur oxidation DsrE/DsrF family protein